MDCYMDLFWSVVTLSTSLTSLKQAGIFFISIYLVALGQGGFKPYLKAFGANHFDEDDPEENKYKISFFNWWYSSICTGTLTGFIVLAYI